MENVNTEAPLHRYIFISRPLMWNFICEMKCKDKCLYKYRDVGYRIS